MIRVINTYSYFQRKQAELICWIALPGSVPTGTQRKSIDGEIPVGVAGDNIERGLVEEKFHLAVEACPNGMVIIDGDGKMVMVNAAIEQQFG